MRIVDRSTLFFLETAVASTLTQQKWSTAVLFQVHLGPFNAPHVFFTQFEFLTYTYNGQLCVLAFTKYHELKENKLLLTLKPTFFAKKCQ